MNDDKFSTKINKFDGKDFSIWKIRIENALKANKCFDATSDDFVTIKTENEVDVPDQPKVELEEKEKFILISALSDKILRRVNQLSKKFGSHF